MVNLEKLNLQITYRQTFVLIELLSELKYFVMTDRVDTILCPIVNIDVSDG